MPDKRLRPAFKHAATFTPDAATVVSPDGETRENLHINTALMQDEISGSSLSQSLEREGLISPDDEVGSAPWEI